MHDAGNVIDVLFMGFRHGYCQIKTIVDLFLKKS
jgi:hypothetical protein